MLSGIVWVGLLGVWGGSPMMPDLPKERIPSLTPYSDVDLPGTLAFTREAGRPWVSLPKKRLIVTAYTDRTDLWTKLRYQAAMKMARWYLGRCQIDLPLTPLRVLPRGTFTKKGLVQWRVFRRIRRTDDDFETMLLFTDSVTYFWGKPPQKVKLLGLSAKIWSREGTNKWRQHFAVWTRLSPVYTTLVHEIGHRLGLVHTKRPYRLMLNGAGVRSSFETLMTSLVGFFSPKLFLFTKKECQVMHRTLAREAKVRANRKKRLRLGKIRVIPPVKRAAAKKK